MGRDLASFPPPPSTRQPEDQQGRVQDGLDKGAHGRSLACADPQTQEGKDAWLFLGLPPRASAAEDLQRKSRVGLNPPTLQGWESIGLAAEKTRRK